MDPQSEKFVIWFTGFYEGEGSVCNDKSNRNRLHISVSQNDRTPLDLAQKRWGGSVRRRIRISPASTKICYGHEWTIRGGHAEIFIKDIEPFMIIPYKIGQLDNAKTVAAQPWKGSFKCHFCDLEYSDPSGRRRHEIKEHISKNQLFCCEFCSQNYKSRDSMNRHIRLNHQPNASSQIVLNFED